MQLQTKDSILAIAQTYFQTEIVPHAEAIDRDAAMLKTALQGMGDRNLLALRVPRHWGGSELEAASFHCFQMMAARYSGAIAFLQTQHQSAGERIAASNNESLKQAYLPRMATGEILVGLGFSQLRRPGEPMVKATSIEGGYRLDGEVPWVTGFDFFAEFIIGATLPDGRAIYAIVPLRAMQQQGGGTIRFSQPMELVAANAANTVKAWLERWFVESDRILAIQPPEAMGERDRKNVLHHGFFALGCAQAGLDILNQAYENRPLPYLQEACSALERELSHCRQAMLDALPLQSQSYERRLQLRAWAIDLAGRSTQAAAAISGGAANSIAHPAQRVYREALLFTVFGQTAAVREATLRRVIYNDEVRFNAGVVQW